MSWIKSFLLGILVAGILGISGISNAADWKEYNNESQRIGIQYPSDWMIDSRKEPGKEMIIFNFPQKDGGVAIIIGEGFKGAPAGDYPFDTMSASEKAAMVEKLFAKTYKNIQEKKNSQGHTLYFMDSVNGENQVTARIVVVVKNEKLIMFWGSADSLESFRSNQKIIDQMFLSIKI